MAELTRREAIGMVGAAAVGAAVGPSLSAHAAAGALRQSVCRWCFSDIPLRDFFRQVRASGLTAVDLLNEEEWAIAREHGLACSTGYGGGGTISDGLNVYSLTDEGHLAPYLTALRARLEAAGHKVAPEHIVVRNGRVRAGYRIGEMLFGNLQETDHGHAILHLIGERPGSGHHAFSVYMTRSPVGTWARAGVTDHNITKVVSGIADTALDPVTAAADTVRVLSRTA